MCVKENPDKKKNVPQSQVGGSLQSQMYLDFLSFFKNCREKTDSQLIALEIRYSGLFSKSK